MIGSCDEYNEIYLKTRSWNGFGFYTNVDAQGAAGSDAAEGSPAVAPGAAEAAQVAHPGLDAAAPDEDAAAEQVCSPAAVQGWDVAAFVSAAFPDWDVAAPDADRRDGVGMALDVAAGQACSPDAEQRDAAQVVAAEQRDAAVGQLPRQNGYFL